MEPKLAVQLRLKERKTLEVKTMICFALHILTVGLCALNFYIKIIMEVTTVFELLLIIQYHPWISFCSTQSLYFWKFSSMPSFRYNRWWNLLMLMDIPFTLGLDINFYSILSLYSVYLFNLVRRRVVFLPHLRRVKFRFSPYTNSHWLYHYVEA